MEYQDRQIKTAGNRRLAQWRVKWLIEHSTSHQLCGVLTVLSSEIRHCAKRQNVSGYTTNNRYIMGFFDRIKSAFLGTSPNENHSDKGKFITSYTDRGEQVLILRSEWRDRILPEQLTKAWDNPDALYESIILAMRDDFFIEVLEAAKHLVQIDKITERSYNALGLIFLHTNAFSEAESILKEGIEKSAYKAVLTTNLAKVYEAQGYHETSMETLWNAIQLDPNQNNALDWYAAIEFEKGGKIDRLAPYIKVAKLPNSWRARIFIARFYLEIKEFSTAKNLYKDILQTAHYEPDAIMAISGDLGNNNRIEDIFELIYPIFDIKIHGAEASINLLQACIETKRKDEGTKLLNDLKKANRFDLLSLINDIERKLNKL